MSSTTTASQLRRSDSRAVHGSANRHSSVNVCGPGRWGPSHSSKPRLATSETAPPKLGLAARAAKVLVRNGATIGRLSTAARPKALATARALSRRTTSAPRPTMPTAVIRASSQLVATTRAALPAAKTTWVRAGAGWTKRSPAARVRATRPSPTCSLRPPARWSSKKPSSWSNTPASAAVHGAAPSVRARVAPPTPATSTNSPSTAFQARTSPSRPTRCPPSHTSSQPPVMGNRSTPSGNRTRVV